MLNSILKFTFLNHFNQSCIIKCVELMFAKDFTLDEALEAIRGAPEFNVVQSGGYTFIKYKKYFFVAN
jgi:hypothetical protein